MNHHDSQTPVMPSQARSNPKGAATFFLASLLALLGLVAVAAAQDQPNPKRSSPIAHVVELFTSQGCDSCPNAEAVLGSLKDQPDVLPLAYHVDYWDYIGWRDTYGAAENTARQRAYGASFSLSTLYTPQMVIDGRTQIVGARESELDEALAAVPSVAKTGVASVGAEIVGENVRIQASMDRSIMPGAMPVLIVVTYDERSETVVTRGENVGETIHGTHPVRDWRILGALSDETMRISLPLSTLTEGANGKNGCAVFIQAMSAEGKPGPILSAARLDLPARR